MTHLVERAILELIEDEMDKELIEERELEETVEWTISINPLCSCAGSSVSVTSESKQQGATPTICPFFSRA